MKHSILSLAALAALATACGSSDSDGSVRSRLIEDIGPDVEIVSSTPTRNLGTVEMEDEHISFIEMGSGGDAPDSVMMIRSFAPTKTVSDYDRLRNELDVPVTFAEAYEALSGSTAPDVLWEHHDLMAAEVGRTLEHLPATRMELPVAKSVQLEANFTPPIPGHHYEEVRLGNVGFNCFSNRPDMPSSYRCSTPQSLPNPMQFFHCYGDQVASGTTELVDVGPPTRGDCTRWRTGWLRQGVMNPSNAPDALDFFVQLYWWFQNPNHGQGTGSLGVLPPDGWFVAVDWLLSSGFPGTMAYNAFGTPHAGTVAKFFSAKVVPN